MNEKLIQIQKQLDGMSLLELKEHIENLIAEYGPDCKLRLMWNAEEFRFDLERA